MMKAAAFISAITAWAQKQDVITALALVGSHARHETRPDSDIDFVFICRDTSTLTKDTSWINRFGKVKNSVIEEWGIVKSVRVFYHEGPEVEFGIAPSSWAALPPDPGTLRVVRDGLVILKDSNGLLTRLLTEK